jgi:hypothetical protein
MRHGTEERGAATNHRGNEVSISITKCPSFVKVIWPSDCPEECTVLMSDLQSGEAPWSSDTCSSSRNELNLFLPDAQVHSARSPLPPEGWERVEKRAVVRDGGRAWPLHLERAIVQMACELRAAVHSSKATNPLRTCQWLI